MIPPGCHTGKTTDGCNANVQLTWNGGSTATLNTSRGTICLTGVQKLADGSLVATGGSGSYGSWCGTLKDNDGDGYVFKLGTKGADGYYSFEADLKTGMDLTGKVC
ncbi:hypothetical protein VSS37_05155 [Candidatus Thiothrix sp. Deng01]|uniref:Uncharacterized protein n=1 Tax=Candidatus Thiothrix phosphatis TaxID=3112415 RepID=A0ABU6CWB1_9GAMM|nr:hypothetical protein [Candidatus Thiothrix sp. Deng01]MEB4590358.1 hypothetical protein [Candidatus Thiothrix sp. Deng01]